MTKTSTVAGPASGSRTRIRTKCLKPGSPRAAKGCDRFSDRPRDRREHRAERRAAGEGRCEHRDPDDGDAPDARPSHLLEPGGSGRDPERHGKRTRREAERERERDDSGHATPVADEKRRADRHDDARHHRDRARPLAGSRRKYARSAEASARAKSDVITQPARPTARCHGRRMHIAHEARGPGNSTSRG